MHFLDPTEPANVSRRSLGRLLVLLALLFPAGSPPCRAADPGALVELGDVEETSVTEWRNQYEKRIAEELGARADQFRPLGPMMVFQQMLQENAARLVPSRKVRYTSTDASGKPRTYSGRVFLPSRKAEDPPLEVPLVIYQHATETRRTFTPYFGKGDETMLGALAAQGCGMAVAMPDGDGMGADPSPVKHAYCHAKTTALCVCDMIRAVLGDLGGRKIFDDVNYIWDGDIYIVGYSEGGFISMAAVRELATNPAYKDIKLTGAACMGAPFDFATQIRNLLGDAKTPYNRPYIPAYFLAAWQDLYPGEVSLADAANPALLKTDASGNVVEWLKGVLSGDQITPLMQARLGGQKDSKVSARAVLNEKWVRDNIENTASRLSKLLEANSLVGGWKPTAPVLLVHDPFDETANFSGTQAVYNDWVKQGVNPIGIVRMAVGNTGTGHVGGALVAIPSAFIWIDADMPRDLMALAKDKLSTAIVNAAPEVIKASTEVLVTSSGLQEANENRALLPLSRIECPEPYTLGYGDMFFKIGKVKVYTIEKKPVFRNQTLSAGTGGYTHLLKEMKNLGDTCELQPGVPYYIAVYPQKTGVALTLKFTGKPGTFKANIKQLKNKVIGRNTPSVISPSSNFKANIFPDNYDHAENGKPFITLPK
jgi:hypothetical protein